MKPTILLLILILPIFISCSKDDEDDNTIYNWEIIEYGKIYNPQNEEIYPKDPSSGKPQFKKYTEVEINKYVSTSFESFLKGLTYSKINEELNIDGDFKLHKVKYKITNPEVYPPYEYVIYEGLVQAKKVE